MFEESNKLIEKVIESNLFDVREIATIERALKFSEIYDIMLNECLFRPTDAKTNIFDFKYQAAQGFNKVKPKGHCPDCTKCIKTYYGVGQNNGVTKYYCTRTNKDTFALNTCEFFEQIKE